MAIRNIVKEGDPILNKVCRPVTNFDDRLATLLDDMRETMIAADGVGLAGPQVGMMRRLFICLDDRNRPEDAPADYKDTFIECINPEIVKNADLKVIYTPLNGTGNKPVRAILDRIGVKSVYVVPEQEYPDGNFPTCPFPNPEIKQVFEIGLEMNRKIGADILLATDPDCDRVGIAVPDKTGELVLMSGNEVGAMLLNYILSQRLEKGTLPKSAIAVKSFVSTDLAEVIAKKYNCTFKNLLTGFKYIGELITNLEKEGRASDFVMGFEESYGYLSGSFVRDKDAVNAALLICEMFVWYKSQGKTLADALEALYAQYGFFETKLLSFTFEGSAGFAHMTELLDSLRLSPPAELAGEAVRQVIDYDRDETGLPRSNVLRFVLDGGEVVVRPSGTEPKLKIYLTAARESREKSRAMLALLEKRLTDWAK